MMCVLLPPIALLIGQCMPYTMSAVVSQLTTGICEAANLAARHGPAAGRGVARRRDGVRSLDDL